MAPTLHSDGTTSASAALSIPEVELSNLHLMTMRADVVRDAPNAGVDPFNQAERGIPTPVDTNIACEVFSAVEDVTVNQRRIAARSIWQGIIDLRSGVRVGDRLTNFHKPNGTALFLDDGYPSAQGGARSTTLRVLRAAPVAGHHIGLTLESIDGVEG